MHVLPLGHSESVHSLADRPRGCRGLGSWELRLRWVRSLPDGLEALSEGASQGAEPEGQHGLSGPRGQLSDHAVMGARGTEGRGGWRGSDEAEGPGLRPPPEMTAERRAREGSGVSPRLSHPSLLSQADTPGARRRGRGKN